MHAGKKQTKNITYSFLVAALLLLFTHREGFAEKNKTGFCFLFDTGTQSIAFSVTRYVLLLFLTVPGSCTVLLDVLPLCVCPAIDYYRDTQHGAMEQWSTSIHKKHRILRGCLVSEQPFLYRVYVRSVGVYSGIMYGCVRYVLRVARVDSGCGVQILFVAS